MPTYARVPYDSYVMSSPVVHVGPLTATARDMALAYAVMAPNEPDHFYSRVYVTRLHGCTFAQPFGLPGCCCARCTYMRVHVSMPAARQAPPSCFGSGPGMLCV